MKKPVGLLNRIGILVLDLSISIIIPFLLVNILFLLLNLEDLFILYFILLLVGTFGLMLIQESLLGASVGGLIFGIGILDQNNNPKPLGFDFRNSMFGSIIPSWWPRLTKQTDFERLQSRVNIVWNDEKVNIRAIRIIGSVLVVWFLFLVTSFVSSYSFANTSIFYEAKTNMMAIKNDQNIGTLGRIENIDFPPAGLNIQNDNGVVVYRYKSTGESSSFALIRLKFVDGKWKVMSTDRYSGNPNIGFSIAKSSVSINVSN